MHDRLERYGSCNFSSLVDSHALTYATPHFSSLCQPVSTNGRANSRTCSIQIMIGNHTFWVCASPSRPAKLILTIVAEGWLAGCHTLYTCIILLSLIPELTRGSEKSIAFALSACFRLEGLSVTPFLPAVSSIPLSHGRIFELNSRLSQE